MHIKLIILGILLLIGGYLYYQNQQKCPAGISYCNDLPVDGNYIVGGIPTQLPTSVVDPSSMFQKTVPISSYYNHQLCNPSNQFRLCYIGSVTESASYATLSCSCWT